jgi:hypothetical protein
MLKCLKWIRGAAVGLATLGVVISPTMGRAAERRINSRPTVRSVDARQLDVALSRTGALSGRVVDHTGAPVEGAEIVVKQGDAEVARSTSDRQGNFTISNLKNGVYTVSSGATVGTYRVWSETTAPPSANAQALLITGKNGARGQFAAVDMSGNLLIAAIAIAGLVVGIITLVEVQEVESKIPTSP